MALKATIFKAELQVSDMDRAYYASHSLTLARHPSETDERMMVRLLAFALNADESLEFGRGISADDEPDLVKKDLTGEIKLWIDVGLPDERDVRKACGRADRVTVYLYGRGAGMWWSQNAPALARHDNLTVVEIPQDASLALAKLAARNMSINCSIQEGQFWLADAGESVHAEPVVLKK
jgi:uncharacterized protein YaeQ